jgi:hypothetical protein
MLSKSLTMATAQAERPPRGGLSNPIGALTKRVGSAVNLLTLVAEANAELEGFEVVPVSGTEWQLG